MDKSVLFTRIFNPSELNHLKSKKARYGSLKFSFTDKYLKELKALLKEKHECQIFAKDAKTRKIVGYCAGAETLFPGFFFLAELFVAQEAQGKGIGRSLLIFVINHARMSGLKGVVTETEVENIPAQRLYKKCGFRRIKNPRFEGHTFRLMFQRDYN